MSLKLPGLLMTTIERHWMTRYIAALLATALFPFLATGVKAFDKNDDTFKAAAYALGHYAVAVSGDRSVGTGLAKKILDDLLSDSELMGKTPVSPLAVPFVLLDYGAARIDKALGVSRNEAVSSKSESQACLLYSYNRGAKKGKIYDAPSMKACVTILPWESSD